MGGFGFIESEAAHAQYNRDVFVHKAVIGSMKIGDMVTFGVQTNEQGMPQARDLAIMPPNAVGAPNANFGKGGKGKGGQGKGGQGKGRGKTKENKSTEKVPTEQVSTEQVTTEQVSTEQVSTEVVSTEKVENVI